MGVKDAALKQQQQEAGREREKERRWREGARQREGSSWGNTKLFMQHQKIYDSLAKVA